MSRLLFFFVLLLSVFRIHAQKEASIWYFGRNAGLSFLSGNPVVLTNGQTYTDEGVASICDANGALLFYTEGVKVWNAQHQLMPNGQGLLGHESSSQSAIIVPKINDPQRYYVFTVGRLGTGSLHYSIVNMSLDNGRGDIETKNVLLQSAVCEKISAVKHCNGRDIWVIAHAFNSANFLSYLVTPAGVNNAIVSTSGTFVTGNVENAIGCMKVSPDGKKIAAAHKRLGVDLLDFNNATGVISNGQPLLLSTDTYRPGRGAYGVEFSPNSKLLYISGDYQNSGERSYVLQYDVTDASITAIRASKYVVCDQQAYWSAENFGTLQNAPDGKMYMGELNQPNLSVINNPNAPGAGCGFVHGQLQVWVSGFGGATMYGLPAYIQSYFKPSFTFRGTCSGNTLYFDYERSVHETSVKWDFGDPASGNNNTATTDSAQHLFSSPGAYTVKLIRYTACGSDTISKLVNAGNLNFDLGADTILCDVSQYVINPQLNTENKTYLWHNGSTGSSFRAINSGLYWVQITDTVSGCSKRDSISVLFGQTPRFSLGPDQDKCFGDTVNLGGMLPSGNYLWNNNFTSNSMQVNSPGTYWLQISKDGCRYRDSVDIVFRSYPVVSLGVDTIVCEGTTLSLHAGNSGMQYQWQNSSKNENFVVREPGIYWVTVSNYNCSASDTIRVNYLRKPVVLLGNDTVLCATSQLMLNSKMHIPPGTSFLWSNGSTDPVISINGTGTFTLTASNRCGVSTDVIKIDRGVCKLYVPSAFTPNGDRRNDLFKVSKVDNLSEFDFRVYNRWGELVFSTKNVEEGWNGTYKGKLQTTSVFTWVIFYKTITEDQIKSMKGTVTLIR